MPPAVADIPLTTAQVAQRFGVPTWRVRRIVDALGVPVPRLLRVRAIPADLLPRIVVELRRHGYAISSEGDDAA